MKKNKILGLVTSREIAKELNTSYTNIHNNYVANKTRDKSKYLELFAIGTFVKMNKLSVAELVEAINIYKRIKEVKEK